MPVRAIPCLLYRDAPGMIDWLSHAFGMRLQVSHADDHGGVAHAELTLGDSVIMLGSWRADGDYAQLCAHPADAGLNSQSVYLVVDDAFAALARVQARGGAIVRGMRVGTQSGDSFICRDPEGYLWCVGTYAPAAYGCGP